MQSDADKDGTVTSGAWQQQLPMSMTSPYRLRLRAKTPSQFPTELASLEHKLDGVEERLELVRKGRGLFKLMRDREKEKVYSDCWARLSANGVAGGHLNVCDYYCRRLKKSLSI